MIGRQSTPSAVHSKCEPKCKPGPTCLTGLDVLLLLDEVEVLVDAIQQEVHQLLNASGAVSCGAHSVSCRQRTQEEASHTSEETPTTRSAALESAATGEESSPCNTACGEP